MDSKQTSSLWTLLRPSVRFIIVSWSTSSASTAAKGKSADGSLTSWIIEGKQWWSAVPVPSLSASSLVYHKGASGWDAACSSFASVTFLTPRQPKLGSLRMTQPHTKWWPAPMTRPNYETSTSLLSGRNDGIWPFTQGNAPHCQWLAAGNPWDTSTSVEKNPSIKVHRVADPLFFSPNLSLTLVQSVVHWYCVLVRSRGAVVSFPVWSHWLKDGFN